MEEWLDRSYYITLTNDGVNRDVAKYVHHSLHAQRSFKRWKSRPDVLDKMEQDITVKANGM